MNKSFSLYNIDEEFQILEQTLFEQEGEIHEEQEELLDVLSDMHEEKVLNYFKLIKNMAATLNAVEDEYKIWRQKRDTLSKSIKYLKQRLHDSMQLHGLDEMDLGNKRTIKIQNNGGKRPLTLKLLPEFLPEFIQVNTISADTELIRSMIGSGDEDEENAYWKLEEAGTHVRLRG